MNKKLLLQTKAWVMGVIVVVLAAIAWSQVRLGYGPVTRYAVFPLLGLSAFSLMWTHYVLGSTRRFLGQDKKALKTYLSVTGVAVLVLILLHPAILWYSLWRDGLGLPPRSYLQAYPSQLHLALILGSMSLAIFLAFELKRFLQKKQWWKFVEYLQILAMLAIFYHALTLGREVGHTWFRYVWYMYGFTLICAVIYNYWYDTKRREDT